MDDTLHPIDLDLLWSTNRPSTRITIPRTPRTHRPTQRRRMRRTTDLLTTPLLVVVVDMDTTILTMDMVTPSREASIATILLTADTIKDTTTSEATTTRHLVRTRNTLHTHLIRMDTLRVAQVITILILRTQIIMAAIPARTMSMSDTSTIMDTLTMSTVQRRMKSRA